MQNIKKKNKNFVAEISSLGHISLWAHHAKNNKNGI